jgi:hypothetical protein
MESLTLVLDAMFVLGGVVAFGVLAFGAWLVVRSWSGRPSRAISTRLSGNSHETW